MRVIFPYTWADGRYRLMEEEALRERFPRAYALPGELPRSARGARQGPWALPLVRLGPYPGHGGARAQAPHPDLQPRPALRHGRDGQPVLQRLRGLPAQRLCRSMRSRGSSTAASSTTTRDSRASRSRAATSATRRTSSSGSACPTPPATCSGRRAAARGASVRLLRHPQPRSG